MRSRLRWLLAVVPLATACGGDETPTLLHNVLFPDAGESEGTDGGTARKDGGTKPSSGSDAGLYDGEDSSFDPDAACAASTVQADEVLVEHTVEEQQTVVTKVPVALYMMLDRGDRMQATGQWTPAKDAIKRFVDSSSSQQHSMALGFFPSDNAVCKTGALYDVPVVPMGLIATNKAAIKAGLDSASPTGLWGTPIEGALRGGHKYCQKYQSEHPGQKCVVVMATQGKPGTTFGECSDDFELLANIAKVAYESPTNSVATYTVRLKGTDPLLLDEIAKRGGAKDCDASPDHWSCDVSDGTGNLSAALEKIREVTEVVTTTKTVTSVVTEPLPCTWNMPEPQPGVLVDKGKVNIILGGGRSIVNFGKVAGATSCGVGGWYFDNANDPKQIVACPQTCSAIAAAEATDVQVQLGCDTQVLVI